MKLLLSIIVPTLNEAEVIEATLQSLQGWRQLKALDREIEIVLVDGGSTDDTLMIAKPLVDRIVHSPPGRGRQMNAGARVSLGKYLLFLHADTRLPENLLGLAGSWQLQNIVWGFFTLRLSGKSWIFRVIERCINWRVRLTRVMTGDLCLFVHRAAFQLEHGFSDIPLMEDVEFSKRMRQRAKPLIEPEFVTSSSRRWEEKGVIKTILLMWTFRLVYFLGVNPKTLAAIYRPSPSSSSGFSTIKSIFKNKENIKN